jgi:hypothetical protein
LHLLDYFVPPCYSYNKEGKMAFKVEQTIKGTTYVYNLKSRSL